jgi:hypothetical protein
MTGTMPGIIAAPGTPPGIVTIRITWSQLNWLILFAPTCPCWWL